MSLRILSRKTKASLLPVEKDVCKLLFESVRAQRACRMLLDEIKRRHGLSRSEFSSFAWKLDRGVDGFSYSRRAFYRQVRRSLISLGLVSFEVRFVDVDGLELSVKRRKILGAVRKYVPVHQPISKRPPDGLNLPRLIWIVCRRWNQEFFREYD